jgi:hypothetical protein
LNDCARSCAPGAAPAAKFAAAPSVSSAFTLVGGFVPAPLPVASDHPGREHPATLHQRPPPARAA